MAALCGSNIALAQDASSGTTEIEEVVVTAQFRAQNLQETPIAITAVTGDMLRARNQIDIQSVAARAPGVNLTSGGLGGSQVTSLFVRGVGQSDFDLGLEPGVGMYIDDVYYGTLFGSLMSLVDLDRIEVLRGPQGTLAGKNSEGGAIKLYSKLPTGQTDGYLEGTVGTLNRREARAGGNFTLIPDRLLVRLTGLAQHTDGYVTSYDYQCMTGQPAAALNPPPSMAAQQFGGGAPYGCKLSTQGGKQVVALRAVGQLIISDKATDTFIYDSTIDHSDPPPAVLTAQGNWNFISQTPGVANSVSDFSTPKGSYYNYATYCGLTGTPYMYCMDPKSNLESWGLSNDLDITFGNNLNFRSISAYRSMYQDSASDQDGSPISWTMNTFNVDYKQFSQELRLSGQTGSQIQWTVGAYYFRYDATQSSRVSIDGTFNNGTTFDFVQAEPVESRSTSGFAHLEYTPIDPLTLTGGLRYTRDTKNFLYGRALAEGYPGSASDAPVLPLNGIFREFSGNKTDYNFTATWKFTQDINVYFATGSGFKGGGVVPRPFFPEQARTFDPETVTSYELGLKSFLFDRRVRLNVSVYHNIYNDIQLTLASCPDFTPGGAPAPCAMPANVGDAKVQGGELELEARLGNAMLDFSADVLNFQYTKVDPATRVTVDMKPPYVPAFKAAIGAQYRFDLAGNGGSITPRVDFNYVGRQQQRAINFPTTWNGGRGLLNARLTWMNADDDTSVSLEGNNLLDRYYGIITAYNFPPVASQANATINPGPPRTIAVTVRKQF
ncbi:MAG: TonB-dependent receptor [Nevskiaceae bacterium]|nr:TonB-dependent receptor [Nevskiaceae bacterium]